MKELQFPLVKIIFWFVLGILFSYYQNTNPELAFSALFISFSLFIISYFYANKIRNSNIIFGISLYLLFFFFGITTQAIHTDFYQSENYIHDVTSSEKEHLITVVLREKLKDTKYSHRYIAYVKNIDHQKSSGKILVNFYKSTDEFKPGFGNYIYLKSAVLKHEKPKNPDQFDYGSYLTHKSILAQTYVNSDDYKVSSKIDKNIWYYSDQLRNRIIDNLKKSGFEHQELNVVAALILGQQQDISPEILHDYQFAGAIHILSVSGLHVGYLLLFLNFLLGALPKTKLFNTIKLSAILLSLWGFAILAGLSPSVVRSAAMFSIVAIGLHLNRKTNIYNTLCISMFFILLFEPSFLFDIGFQLSYVALFFIIWLYPLINDIWNPKYKIIKYLWEIMAVSLAAQIGALPLSIYYFHQFPGLFFITNLIVIPILGFIMVLGVLVMLLAAFNFIPAVLSKTLEWSISFLNEIIHWVASFESFIIKSIPFNGLLLLSLYLIIIAFAIWFKKPNNYKMIVALATTVLFQSAYLTTVWKQKNQKEFIVFNVKKATLIGKKEGDKITLLTNDTLQENTMLNSYLTANFNPEVDQKKLQNLIYFNQNKILIIDQSGIYPTSIHPDVVVITKSPKLNLERMLKSLRPKIVVADASNYKTFLKKWKATCIKEKIPFHATGEKGFYRLP